MTNYVTLFPPYKRYSFLSIWLVNAQERRPEFFLSLYYRRTRDNIIEFRSHDCNSSATSRVRSQRDLENVICFTTLNFHICVT